MSSAEDGPRASRKAAGEAEPGGELLPERVAELAGQLSETSDESRRRRLARQIAQLAGRSGQATVSRLQVGTGAARRGVQSGTGALVRRVRPASTATLRRATAGRTSLTRRASPGGAAAVRGVRAGGQWLTTQVLAMGPKVPIRSLGTLQAQYPGRDPEDLANKLIAGAARASAGVGAAVGAAAAVPFVPTVPVELGVETLALVAIELKLIAELHEVYRMPAPGSAAQRMMAYTGAWAERRGVRISSNGVALAVGSPLRRKLERRLLVKASQSTLALAPLLTGAAAGALIDHHETHRLGNLVRDDLRKRSGGTSAHS